MLTTPFDIDGYQPAPMCFQDQVGGSLLFDDIRNYQRMFVALPEKLMELVGGE